jgi:hypothetical protein
MILLHQSAESLASTLQASNSDIGHSGNHCSERDTGAT